MITPEINGNGEEETKKELGLEGKENKSMIKKPKAQKLRSGKKPTKSSEDDEKVEEADKISVLLSSVYNDLKENLEGKIEDAKGLDANNIIAADLEDLLNELYNLKVPQPLKCYENIDGIKDLQALDNKLRALEKNLQLSQPSTEQLKNLFNDTVASVNAIKPLLDPSNISEANQELQRLGKEMENSISPRDQLQVISGINPILQDIIRANKKKTEDSHREIAEITEKLNVFLKEFDEVLKQSQQTLQQIENNFKPDEETIKPICAAYINRAKDLINSIDSFVPYTQTLPKVASLLVDMEKFKREMMDDDINKKLNDLLNAHNLLIKEIAEELKIPEGNLSKLIEEPSKSLNDTVKTLEKAEKISNALVNKLLGKDIPTGIPEIDNIKPRDPKEGVLLINPLNLLKHFWIHGKEEQDKTEKASNILAEAVGNEEEKSHLAELLEIGQKTVCGIIPEEKQAALEQLNQSLEEYIVNKSNQSGLIENLANKVQEKLKEAEVKIEAIEELWKAIMLSEKISEKLVTKEPPNALEELKKVIEALPPKPSQLEMEKLVVKFQEINLGLLNQDEELTNEEVKEIEAAAKRRARGKGKGKAIQNKGKRALRSGKGGAKKINLTEPELELLENTVKTTSELASWVFGHKPSVVKHLKELELENEPIRKLMQDDSTGDETLDKMLETLKKYEIEKQGIIANADVTKNLLLVLQKCQKMLETTEKIVNVPIPSEIEQLNKKKPPVDLSDMSKRIGFYLSIFFKMVKEYTGLDEDSGENLEDVLSAIKKKQAISLLPFDPHELYNELKTKAYSDIHRLKLLTNLVGTEEEVSLAADLETQINELLAENSPTERNEVMDDIERYLHVYPDIEKEIAEKTDDLLERILQRFCNPEPLERDVGNLIEASERLDLALKKLSSSEESLPEIASLRKRKDEMPTSPKELMPYMTLLVNDMSKTNLDLIALTTGKPLTKEEDKKLQQDVTKKLKAAPVQIVRDIEPYFTGPGLEDTIAIIIKLHKATEFFNLTQNVGDLSLYSSCVSRYPNLNQLAPSELKELCNDYADVLLSFVDLTDSFERIHSEVDEDITTTITARKDTSIKSKIRWADIFKGRGIDINSELLCECINEEQKLALIYIEGFPKVFGSQEQKNQSKFLEKRATEIMNESDEKSKIENYIQLRLEESKLISLLSPKVLNMFERLTELDKERENNMSVGINEVGILIEKNNPDLKVELDMIISKEEEYKGKPAETGADKVMRIANRLSLEKELQRIKEEAKPSDNSQEEMIRNLTEIENKLYKELKALNTVLIDYSQDLSDQIQNMKHLTEPQVSTTIPALLASLNIGFSSHSQLISALNNLLEQSPVKIRINKVFKIIEKEAPADDTETEVVFSGLFRLCGNTDDKAAAKKLREGRSLPLEEKTSILSMAEVLELQLEKFLPIRSAQSKLQSKLIKDAGKMRDGIDEIDLQTEELLTKAAREVANSILSDDNKSRLSLENIRKSIEEINENSPTNIPDCIDRISKRLDVWDRLERLRRELRERSSKEINKLKGEIQDKLNELATVTATLEGQKNQYEAQIALLQNRADLNASLVEKLTLEAVEKDKALSNLKNSVSDLKNETESLREDISRLEEENESNNKELRNLRKINKDKEGQIRELQNSLDNFERSTEKSSLGDKEKSEVLDNLKNENKLIREELAIKSKIAEELEDKLADNDRNFKKLDAEKSGLEKDLEKSKAEKQQLKAELMKLAAEKSELDEKLKLGEGINPDEIKQLERILEDKQRELEESLANLAVARRYQLLYPEITSEKEEIESKLRDSEIKLEDSKRRFDELKKENDINKFKLSTLDQIQAEANELQKENQRLQLRLNYLEQSSGTSKEVADAGKKVAEEIGLRDDKIKDLLDEIARLKKEIEDQLQKYRKSLSRSFLVRLCHTFKEMEGQSFMKWRTFRVDTGLAIDFTAGTAVSVIPINEEEKKLKEDYELADKAINEENKKALENNKIVQMYTTLGNKSEKPMSIINIFKFLEDLMDKKFEADKQDAINLLPLRTIPDFLIDNLMKTFGIQSLAMKFLSQFIPGFYQLFNEGQVYAIFFARLLQVFHADPIPFNLAIYLVKARMDFCPLIDKYERLQAEQFKSSPGLKRSDTLGRAVYETASNGGLALLSDVLELVYSLFVNDKEAGEKVLELIKPKKLSTEDFVAFKICHKMAKLGKTPEMIFTILDKDGGGTIDINEFILGTKDDLDLWISEKNITKLLKLLDTRETGEILKEDFMEKINMKFLMECNKNPALTVSKSAFLISLTEVYKYKQRKMAAHLNPKLQTLGGFVGKNNFGEILQEYDLNMSPENSEKLFKEAKNPENNTAEFLGLVSAFSKYGLGDLKAFKIRELHQELSRRNLVQKISETESISTSTKQMFTSLVQGNIRIDRDEEEKTIIRKKIVKKLVKRSN